MRERIVNLVQSLIKEREQRIEQLNAEIRGLEDARDRIADAMDEEE